MDLTTAGVKVDDQSAKVVLGSDDPDGHDRFQDDRLLMMGVLVSVPATGDLKAISDGPK